jgi:hypothetical protein
VASIIFQGRCIIYELSFSFVRPVAEVDFVWAVSELVLKKLQRMRRDDIIAVFLFTLVPLGGNKNPKPTDAKVAPLKKHH